MDKSLLEQQVAEDVGFFGNSGKAKRELMIVDDFLKCSSIEYDAGQLRSPGQDSDVDVLFRQARFQVKEITNPGERRQRDLRSNLQAIRHAERIEDIRWPAPVYDSPPPIEGNQLVLDAARDAKLNKYANKSKIDLLFYVTRTHASHIDLSKTDVAQFEALGWRSVSVLMGDRATIICSLESPILRDRLSVPIDSAHAN